MTVADLIQLLSSPLGLAFAIGVVIIVHRLVAKLLQSSILLFKLENEKQIKSVCRDLLQRELKITQNSLEAQIKSEIDSAKKHMIRNRDMILKSLIENRKLDADSHESEKEILKIINQSYAND